MIQVREFLEITHTSGIPAGGTQSETIGVVSHAVNSGIRVSSSGMYYCWIAREVFGHTNPKWLKFRRWLLTKAPEKVREYYIEYGYAIAQSLKQNPIMKEKYRITMNNILQSI